MERLDKFLCDSGAGTRSQVKPIIKSGRVTVDGKVAKDPAMKVDPQNQSICLDAEPLGGNCLLCPPWLEMQVINAKV